MYFKSSYGRTSFYRQVKAYIDQFCAYTGCSRVFLAFIHPLRIAKVTRSRLIMSLLAPSRNLQHFTKFFFFAQSARAVDYPDCTSAEW